VLRQGGHVQHFIPIQKQPREVLDAWLEKRGTQPGLMFLSCSGKWLDRTQAFLILKRMARQTNVHLPRISTSRSRRLDCAIPCSGRW
jgi:hypothetical protein